MRRLIETIVRRLSDRPEETRVTESVEGKMVVYEISVPEPERGRSFVGAAASARGKRVLVRVRD